MWGKLQRSARKRRTKIRNPARKQGENRREERWTMDGQIEGQTLHLVTKIPSRHYTQTHWEKVLKFAKERD